MVQDLGGDLPSTISCQKVSGTGLRAFYTVCTLEMNAVCVLGTKPAFVELPSRFGGCCGARCPLWGSPQSAKSTMLSHRHCGGGLASSPGRRGLRTKLKVALPVVMISKLVS